MNTPLSVATKYYTAMGNKNMDGMGKFLHPDISFQGPLAQIEGKEGVLDAAIKLASIINGVNIRRKFENKDQAMLVLDLDFPAPVGHFPSASLVTVKEGLITNIELFYDARPLDDQKRDAIFSKK
ncbi:MAG: nuclear transport factor 2 family protein [Alphaproteobacteria bacterium]|nr:nuclear transport factor 2 family protein [Alphaproteobacteria bacterium]